MPLQYIVVGELLLFVSVKRREDARRRGCDLSCEADTGMPAVAMSTVRIFQHAFRQAGARGARLNRSFHSILIFSNLIEFLYL